MRFFNLSPSTLLINTAGIFTSFGSVAPTAILTRPSVQSASPLFLLYTIAPTAPAFCTFNTFTPNSQSPLSIKAIFPLMLDVSDVQAFCGLTRSTTFSRGFSVKAFPNDADKKSIDL